jgi:hypothetical protein
VTKTKVEEITVNSADRSTPSKKEDGAPRRTKLSEQMRGNRPYLFSESEQFHAPRLERSQLEYHLETLTGRKEEYLFEN